MYKLYIATSFIIFITYPNHITYKFTFLLLFKFEYSQDPVLCA